MKILKKTTLFISLALLSCKNDWKRDSVNNAHIDSAFSESLTVNPEHQSAINISDSIKRFVVDDYPVTFEMIKKQNVDNYSSYSKTSGKTKSIDKVWFSNNTLKQTLIFELYTDGHRLVTYHFNNNDIPLDVIERIELHNFDGKLANKQQELIDFKGFLSQSALIDRKYFITNKGLKLGDHKYKALEIYGPPDKKTVHNGVEKLDWHFVGDFVYDGKVNLKGRPLAKDNYGHQAYLFFKKEKLIGQILHNDIP